MCLAVASALPQRDSDDTKNDKDEMEEKVEDDKKTIEIFTPDGLMVGLKVFAEKDDSNIFKNDFNHYRFLGIPYAEAPVDELRFHDPVPVHPWQGVMNATEFSAQCPQPGFFVDTNKVFGEENCLFLNVFTPRLPATRRNLMKISHSSSASFTPPPQSSLLPVMVYIHGGGFIIGSGEKDPEPLIRKGVVVVTINYRLGPLGFFAGNQGLKDQVRKCENISSCS